MVFQMDIRIFQNYIIKLCLLFIFFVGELVYEGVDFCYYSTLVFITVWQAFSKCLVIERGVVEGGVRVDLMFQGYRYSGES